MEERDTIVARLREQILSGEDWHRAMLLAAADWPLQEEVYQEERFAYLIDDEALDLSRLYERLCAEIEDLVPSVEIEELLVRGKSPSGVSRDEIRQILGPERYKAYLTYIYGVIVEELVVLAVVEDLRRRRRVSGLTHYDANRDDAYVYVYGEPLGTLVKMFKKEAGEPRRRSMNMTQLREFTYWLFKLRLKNSDKSRVASDTKRALLMLHRFTETRERLSS